MRRSAAVILGLLSAGAAAHAQRGMGDWMTSGYDAQRSHWVRTDGKISPESMRKPGFELVWKMKFDNAPRGLNNISPPALIDFYIGYRGFRALGFFGGSSNHITTVDTDLARTEWTKDFPASRTAATADCPGGMTSAVTRPTSTAYGPPPVARGAGRGSPAKSAVGEPHEGAALLKTVPAAPPVRRAPPRPAAADLSNPFAPRVQYLVALTGDGKLHSFWVSNGNEPKPPVPFIPPDANANGLIVYEDTAYVSTTNRCGGVDDGVWALDLKSGKVKTWKPQGGKVAGTAGPASGPDGTLYAAAGKELAALAPGTLERRAVYDTGGAEFTSSPVVFEFKGRNLVAAATNDGRLHLVEAANVGKGAVARSEAYSAPNFAAGALASWQDAAGTRWVLAPAAGNFRAPQGEIKNGAIVAWKVVDNGGKIALQPGWVSRDMISPLPPIVVNGVVFAVSSGESRGSGPLAERMKRSVPGVLYALDSETGKELWSSGSAIQSFVHSGSLAAGGNKIYVSGYDGTQYAFGFPIEH